MRPLYIIAALLVLAAPASAQTTETPVAFDAAGRILSVNPSLATRLALTQPAWPVADAFIEARLFQVSTGGYVLAVTRSGGAVNRYPLDDSQAAALRQAFVEGIARTGRLVSEDATNIISEPARGPFVRDQMLLSAAVYGPALASLTDDASLGTGAYMLAVGTSFFAVNDFARKRTISKSQNSLTTDGALRGWAATALAANMLAVDLSNRGAAWTSLVGGIGGSIVGFHRGTRLTNSEAEAAMTGSTLAAGALLGTGVTTGAVGEDSERMASASILAGGIAGYILGPEYPRRARYTVTAGDISVVRLGAILGAMAAITPLVEMDDIDEKAAGGVLTAGWIGGAILADRIGSKPFNHSAGDARMIGLGAVGGGLMGLALPIMSESESPFFAMGAVTTGAILGSIVTQRMMDPSREGAILRNQGGSNTNSAKFEFKPEGALMAATGQRGNHTLLRIRF